MHPAGPVSILNDALLPNGSAERSGLRFGLSISAFDWPGGEEAIGERLAAIAVEAEHAGFDSLWVMDHFMQIPQIGREWHPMLEAYTALSFLAARTSRVSIGALVSCVTHRNLAHLGKIVASLDVVSGGRARCGLGIGWYEREHRAYGYDFPSVGDRYADARRCAPVPAAALGAGFTRIRGNDIFDTRSHLLSASAPRQDSNSGRWIGREAHTRVGCAVRRCVQPVSGNPDVVAQKIAVLGEHAARTTGRTVEEIEVTQLSPIVSAADRGALADRVDLLRGARPADDFAITAMAATAEEHVDRFSRLSTAGVDTVIVSLADVGYESAVSDFAPVISACSE